MSDASPNLLAQAPVADTLDRMPQLDSNSFGLDGTGLIVLAVVAAAVLAALAVGGVVLARRLEKRRALRNLQDAARRQGLDADEWRLLNWIAHLSGAKRIDAVLSLNAHFEKGVEKLLEDPRVLELSRTLNVPVTAIIRSLRQKLGLEDPQQGRSLGSHVLESLHAGCTLSVQRPQEPSEFSARLVKTSKNLTDFVLEVDEEIHCQAEEKWSLRKAEEGLFWEFDAIVQRRAGKDVFCCARGEARYVNRRRFSRIPTRKEALISMITLLGERGELLGPQMREAVVVELGGPGMLLECDESAEVGTRLLMHVDLGAARVLQGVAVVKRCTRG
jgi:hypothetical protein